MTDSLGYVKDIYEGISVGITCPYRCKIHNGNYVIFAMKDGKIIEIVKTDDVPGFLKRDAAVKRLYEMNGLKFGPDQQIKNLVDSEE